jgi:iron complex transport system substrate-binding protein
MNLARRLAALLTTLMACAALAPAAHAAAPKRIVALTPFTANTLVQLGVKPVAIGQTLGGRDRIDARLKGVPVLTLTHPNGPNLEQLATRNPGLVLSSPTWNRGHQAMKRLGMKVAVSEPTKVTAVAAETIRIGKLVGRERQARAIAAKVQRGVASAQRGISKRPKVLVILAVGRSPFAMLENSWGGDVVKRAGGSLLTQGLRAGGGFARISNEAVVERNPDIIIAVPHGNPGDIGKLASYLRTNPAWQSTNAARTNRIYVSTGNSLLQPWTDVGRIIRDVRSKYLRN